MKRPRSRETSAEREKNVSAKRRRRRSRSQRGVRRSQPRSSAMSHHYMSQPPTPQGENMYVVWTGDGKPVTVIKAKRASTGGKTGSGSKGTGSASSSSAFPGFGSNTTQPPNSQRTLVRTLSSPPKLGRSQKPKLEKEYNTLKTKEHEDQVELRRLRTENRLLRQRIDNLEKETATLADRLIQDQVIRAQKEEEIYVLRRDLSTQKQQYSELQQLYNSTVTELREFKEKASVVSSMPTVTESEQLERIQQLSGQLAESKHRETELTTSMKELREQIRDLESANRQLQKDPTTEIQQLQEELIACKLREAEANLSMKELRQRVADLDKYWQKHMERQSSWEGTPNKSRQQQIAEELMAVRLREAESLAELKSMKQKVMELETQNQILNRQLKRMDAENASLKERLDDDDKYENELKVQLKEAERREADLLSKRKEDEMMVKIKDAEHSQTVAEMRQRIAELEIENQEMLTAGSFKGDTRELENRVADLQEEVMQLKMAKRLQSISSMALNHMTLDTESDYDTDDMDATLTDADKLRLRQSSFGGVSVDSTELTLAEINKLKLQDLDSSEGEGNANSAFEQENGTLKRRTSKSKKKRAHSKSDAIKKVLEKKNSSGGGGGIVVDSASSLKLEGDTGNTDKNSDKTELTGNGLVSVETKNGGNDSQSETTVNGPASDNTKEVRISNTSNDASALNSEPESVSSIPSSTGAGHVNGVVSTTASNSGYDSTSSVN